RVAPQRQLRARLELQLVVPQLDLAAPLEPRLRVAHLEAGVEVHPRGGGQLTEGLEVDALEAALVDVGHRLVEEAAAETLATCRAPDEEPAQARQPVALVGHRDRAEHLA